MGNPEHVGIVKQGRFTINEWRADNQGERFDLREAGLRYADLTGVDLSGARLRDADLRDAYLTGAILSSADLSGAKLSSADLTGARLRSANLVKADIRDAALRKADLRDANLDGANLSGATLSGANLRNANLRRARVSSTIFAFTDLSSTKGLKQVWHSGRSEIGTHTLFESKGQIPEEFLKGCGLSSWEIEMAKLYDPDLTANQVSNLVSTTLFDARTEGPLYIGGVFISYSHADKGLADKVYNQLKEAGVSVWLDRHDMNAGDINKQVQRELRLRDIVVLILSESSTRSDWVEHELKMTRQKERDEKRDVLCPITLDDEWKSKMDNPNWGHLSDKLVLDFSKWKTKAFAGQFKKLLNGMKINYEVKEK